MLVSELTGSRLALWVGRVVGADFGPDHDQVSEIMIGGHSGRRGETYAPHEDWAQGGPIIEQMEIDLRHVGDEWVAGCNSFIDSSGYEETLCQWIDCENKQSGPMPLIAAMRALVARKFGSTLPEQVAA